MELINRLKEAIFNKENKRTFLKELRENSYEARKLFGSYMGRSPQWVFLTTFVEEMLRKLPECKVIISIRVEMLDQTNTINVSRTLNVPLEEVIKSVCSRCSPEYMINDPETYPCIREVCFLGAPYKNRAKAEIDALIVGEEGYCLLEYQKRWKSLCGDFMKIYRFHQDPFPLQSTHIDNLFVTSLPSKKSVKDFTSYMERAETILNKLFDEAWGIVAIVGPFNEEKDLLLFPEV